MDVVFMIITSSATHAEGVGVHMGGELLQAWPSEAITEPATVGRRTGFGFISDVPTEDIEKLRELCLPVLDEDGSMVRRVNWRVDSTLMTSEELETIVNTNQLDSTWDRFKEVCKNQETGAFITDEDII